jgi:hypothetical protein
VTHEGTESDFTPRLLIVAVDHEQVLIGSAGRATWGLWSDSPAVVLVAVEYMRHDMGLQRLAEIIGVEKMTKIWNEDSELRRLARARGGPGFGPEEAAVTISKVPRQAQEKTTLRKRTRKEQGDGRSV